jgi:hypothetical protein
MTFAPVVVAAVVPLLSVLLGAGMTYWFNVRTRRRTHIEDAFNEAVAAVAVADASKSYLRRVSKPAEMSAEEYRGLLAGIAKTAVENHTQRCGEAREALARVLPYEPAVKQYYENAEAVTDQTDAIISVLSEAQRRHARSRRIRSRS